MSGHTVTLNLEYGSSRVERMTCLEPADAMCHVVWDCQCEWWCKAGVSVTGKPWHVPGDYSEPEYERHYGDFDPTVCNIKHWAENDDEVLRGEVTFAVEPTWEDDHYTFAAIPEKDNTPALFGQAPP